MMVLIIQVHILLTIHHIVVIDLGYDSVQLIKTINTLETKCYQTN